MNKLDELHPDGKTRCYRDTNPKCTIIEPIRRSGNRFYNPNSTAYNFIQMRNVGSTLGLDFEIITMKHNVEKRTSEIVKTKNVTLRYIDE
jgi:hypothetical protein